MYIVYRCISRYISIGLDIHISIYVFIDIHIDVYLHIDTSVYVYTEICTYVYLYIEMYTMYMYPDTRTHTTVRRRRPRPLRAALRTASLHRRCRPPAPTAKRLLQAPHSVAALPPVRLIEPHTRESAADGNGSAARPSDARSHLGALAPAWALPTCVHSRLGRFPLRSNSAWARLHTQAHTSACRGPRTNARPVASPHYCLLHRSATCCNARERP